MSQQHLTWTALERRPAYTCRVFSVRDTISRAPDGSVGTFSVIDAADWAIVVPVVRSAAGDAFLMVRQWRHGSEELSLEFPGGVVEAGEAAPAAALRELEEETGWTAAGLRELGVFSPNPAIMSNRVHIFLAAEMKKMGHQNLDADEYLDVETVPVPEAIAGMGRPPYVHALMASALALYLRLGKGA